MTQNDGYSELLKLCLQVPDWRSDHGKRHQLSELLFVLLVAVLAGAQDAEGIASFGRRNLVWLRQFLSLQHGIASHDTFLTVLAMVPCDEIQRLVDAWTRALCEPGALSVDGGHVAFDGQSLRGSADRRLGLSPVHLVSAYFTDRGVTLGTVKVDDKSNEITAIPDLVRALDLRGATVTIDAMGCQREIARTIREAGADYILQVKGNQPTLQADVEAAVAELVRRRLPGEARADYERHRDVDKGHGRIETRVCVVSRDLRGIQDRDGWKDVAGFAAVLRERRDAISDKTSKEISYFIFSRPTVGAAKLAGMVRNHWAIENELHWSMDVTWGSDGHKVRNRRAAENLGRVRRFCGGLVKRATGWGMSGRRMRQECGWDPDLILQVVAGHTIERPRLRRLNRKTAGRSRTSAPKAK